MIIDRSFYKVLTHFVATNRDPVRNTDKYLLNSAPECVVLIRYRSYGCFKPYYNSVDYLSVCLFVCLSKSIHVFVCMSVCFSLSLSQHMWCSPNRLGFTGSIPGISSLLLGLLNPFSINLSWWKPIIMVLNYASFIRNHYPLPFE